MAGLEAIVGKPSLLFLLLILGGESVLLPALRLNLGNERYLLLVLALAVLASVTSDLFWYAVGRFAAAIPALAGNRYVRRAKSQRWVQGGQFEAHWKKALVLSKFVYGARASAQVLCGATQRPMAIYLPLNALGTLLLVSYLLGMTALLARGFSFLDHGPNVVATVLATLLCSFFIGRGVWVVYHHRSRL